MNRYDDHEPPRRSMDEELRAVLGAGSDDFDYDALIAGTKVRAGRIRRRRALAQGVTAAVLVPALVGAGWMVGQGLDGTRPGTDMAGTAPDGVVATQEATQDPVDDDAATVTEDATAPRTDDGAEGTTDVPATTTEPSAPPYQDATLLTEPLLGLDQEGTPNRIEVPDVRPTDLSAPGLLGYLAHAEEFQNITPAINFTESQAVEGIDAHSARSWTYSRRDGDFSETAVAEIVITVTAWDDSELAMRELTTGGDQLRSTWINFEGGTVDAQGVLQPAPGPGVPVPSPWPGHEGDPDHFLTVRGGTSFDFDYQHALALVRQGDYLVAVSVQDPTEETALRLAAEIAEKSVANLVALDPAHGTGR